MKFLKILFWILLVAVLLAGAAYLLKENFSVEEKSPLELDVFFLRLSVKEGAIARSSIRVFDYQEQEFSISWEGADISTAFNLSEGSSEEEKIIKVIFNAETLSPGLYVGNILIKNNGNTRVIPVILEVQSSLTYFYSSVAIFPEGIPVFPGQKINTEVAIYDLDVVSGRKVVDLEYFIRNFEGILLFSGEDSFVLDGDYRFSKTIDIPLDVPLGPYMLGIVLKQEESVAVSSHFFEISSKTEKSIYSENLFWILIIFGSLLFILLFFVVYLVLSKERLEEKKSCNR
jgi:hypothetical protein